MQLPVAYAAAAASPGRSACCLKLHLGVWAWHSFLVLAFRDCCLPPSKPPLGSVPRLPLALQLPLAYPGRSAASLKLHDGVWTWYLDTCRSAVLATICRPTLCCGHGHPPGVSAYTPMIDSPIPHAAWNVALTEEHKYNKGKMPWIYSGTII